MRHDIIDANTIASETATAVADKIRGLLVQGIPPARTSEANTDPMPLANNIETQPDIAFSGEWQPARTYAIDGGSSLLGRIGSFEIVCWRAGWVAFDGVTRIEEFCRQPQIDCLPMTESMEMLSEYAAAYPGGIDAGQTPGRAVDELRWLAEWRCLEEILAVAPSDSLILMDGTLRANPLFHARYQRDILQKAAARNLHIASVTKQSSVFFSDKLPYELIDSFSRYPGKPRLRKVSAETRSDSRWMGHIYLGRFHPGTDRAFLVHINRFDTLPIERWGAALQQVCDDVEFAGYPYPLVAAHRLARIDPGLKIAMYTEIAQAAKRQGIPEHDLSYIFRDIHDSLNADQKLLLEVEY